MRWLVAASVAAVAFRANGDDAVRGQVEADFVADIVKQVTDGRTPAAKSIFENFGKAAGSLPNFRISVLDLGASSGDVKQTDDMIMTVARNSSGHLNASVWHGFAVEPMTPCFSRLSDALSTFPDFLPVNGLVAPNCSQAVVPFFAPSPQFYLDHANDGAAHHQLWQLGSFDKENFTKLFRYDKKYVHEYSVSCLSVEHLIKRLVRHGVSETTLHMLSIDTNGHDHAILVELLKRQVYPLILQVKDEFYMTAEIKAMRTTLTNNNYIYFDFDVNTIALHLPPSVSATAIQGYITTSVCRVAKMRCNKE
eukprot:m.22166 g.22166  ORF g.22166 m.22166 type:complete len:308 (-) comp10662_c0_seq1:71-994(-)